MPQEVAVNRSGLSTPPGTPSGRRGCRKLLSSLEFTPGKAAFSRSPSLRDPYGQSCPTKSRSPIDCESELVEPRSVKRSRVRFDIGAPFIDFADELMVTEESTVAFFAANERTTVETPEKSSQRSILSPFAPRKNLHPIARARWFWEQRQCAIIDDEGADFSRVCRRLTYE